MIMNSGSGCLLCGGAAGMACLPMVFCTNSKIPLFEPAGLGSTEMIREDVVSDPNPS